MENNTHTFDFGTLDQQSVDVVSRAVERAKNGESIRVASQSEVDLSLAEKFREGFWTGGRTVVVAELLGVALCLAWPRIKEAGRKVKATFAKG